MRLLLLLSLLFVSTSEVVWAKEPANLAQAKNAIIAYHDSGEYERDIEKVIAESMRYLKLALQQGIPQGKKPAIVLDVDETALSNYDDMVKMNFGGTLQQIIEAENKGQDPAILPTLKLYRFAKENKVAVFFVTGRKENERQITESNLKAVGYDHWDGLVLRNNNAAHETALNYKIAARSKIVADGYHIILTLGDQKSDITGLHAGKGFKLPGPFYLIK